MIIDQLFKHLLASKTSRNTVCSITLVVLISTSSCNGNAAKTTNGSETLSGQNAQKNDTNKTAGRAAFAGEQLRTLYIKNFAGEGNQQLGKLLTKANGQGENLKLIFQFYRNDQNILRILVIPAGRGNSGYFLTDTVQPMVSDQLNPPLESKDIFFGDLQLSNQTTSGGPNNLGAIKDLKDHVYNGTNSNSGYEYIWFVPEVVPITEPTGPPSSGSAPFTRNYVVYKVTSCSVAPTQNNLKTVKFILTSYSNPSPPRRLE